MKTKPNEWQEQARRIIKEFAHCKTTSEKIQYIEMLGDSSTDLAVLEEILEFAVLGAIEKGTRNG